MAEPFDDVPALPYLLRFGACTIPRPKKAGDNTLVIHYSGAEQTVACGRTGSSLTTTHDTSRVSCKLCLRTVEKNASEPVRKSPSLAELRAAAKAKQPAVEQPVVAAVTKPVSTITARAEWLRRLEQLPGRNRLPRGVSRQTFI